MTPEIGQFALVLALMAALYQGVFPMFGAARGDVRLMASARSAAIVQFLLVLLSFGALTIAHASDDFSVLNVVQNSHSAKPFIYKLSGVWGNHEGSMLLWALILAGYGLAVAATAPVSALRARTLAVQGLVAASFLAFIILTSNPFARVFPAPANGQDLNPLLQDPGLAIHPPFLYLGYVGFSIAFAFAVAGLIGGRIDQAWAREARPWTLIAWTFLTIGIALGSWWAYYELGWGGFWMWDPVENASFMPWLAGTALIHSLRVTEVRGALRSWTVLLAISTFSLSLVGTFLVRSGIITSVHAFAVDPTRGVFILGILAAVTGGSLAVFAVRGPALGAGASFSAVSRETGLVANNVILSAACATVFIGTFYPLFVELIAAKKISVGAPYFNLVFLPFFALMFALIAPASALAWKTGDLHAAFRRVAPALAASAAALVIAWFVYRPDSATSLAGVALAGWAGAAVIIDLLKRVRAGERGAGARMRALPRSYLAMAIAHLGVAIVAFGVIGAGAWKIERNVYMNPGSVIALGHYEVMLSDVSEAAGPNYRSEIATFSVRKGGSAAQTVRAERRFYPVRGMQTTEAGIRTTAGGDVYLTIGAYQEGRGWVVRAWRHPLVAWMWIGAGVMALGGVIGALGPVRAARARLAAAPAAAE